MILVPQHVITAGMVSSTATNEAAWSAATTYALSAPVSKSGKRFLSLQAGNLNHDPEEVDSLWWASDGPVNSMRMFDISPATKTDFGGVDSTVTITPTIYCTTLLLSGVQALKVRLQCYDGATLKDTREKTLWTSDGTEWGYDFGEVFAKGDAVFDVLPVPCSHFVLTLYSANEVGAVFLGRRNWIGDADKGARSDTGLRGTDYTDANGNLVASTRGVTRILSARTHADRSFFNHFQNIKERLAGEYAAWIVAPDVGDYDSAVLIGRYQSFDIELDANGTQGIAVNLNVMGSLQFSA